MSAARLPEKLSALIKVAVEDARAAESSAVYILDMRRWHEPTRGGHCFVCMAGAVMAFSLGCKAGDSLTPSDALEEKRLLAVNDVRIGDVGCALDQLRVDLSAAQLDEVERAEELIDSAWCDDDRRADWDTYLEAADMLARVGL